MELHHDHKLDAPSGTGARRSHPPRLHRARESFMPGVLLAVRRVAELEHSPTVGLEQLL